MSKKKTTTVKSGATLRELKIRALEDKNALTEDEKRILKMMKEKHERSK